MSLTNIKNMKDERGFTLVELLIVIIIIAILAAITIVAYNGITDRANNSAAQDAASQVRTKVLAWQTIKGAYPTQAQVEGGLNDTDTTNPAKEAKFDSSLVGKIATGSATQSKDVPLKITPCGSDATKPTGIDINYWQAGGTANYKDYKVGDC